MSNLATRSGRQSNREFELKMPQDSTNITISTQYIHDIREEEGTSEGTLIPGVLSSCDMFIGSLTAHLNVVSIGSTEREERESATERSLSYLSLITNYLIQRPHHGTRVFDLIDDLCIGEMQQ
ncbi:hypothetical protein C5167_017224 [Papaver somniferum]|uniref:Uncharacterized protein n=1 Tax=Papaver somniferum TaxID=3469 RepID=A0A4Y7IIT2_PAPSO|nr:hypothetical protein C5167_017224 [Papaver somniferum]